MGQDCVITRPLDVRQRAGCAHNLESVQLHPTAAGRVYAAYGGMYVTIALGWLWLVDGVRPQRWDYLGVALCLSGMAVIVVAPR